MTHSESEISDFKRTQYRLSNELLYLSLLLNHFHWEEDGVITGLGPNRQQFTLTFTHTWPFNVNNSPNPNSFGLFKHL